MIKKSKLDLARLGNILAVNVVQPPQMDPIIAEPIKLETEISDFIKNFNDPATKLIVPGNVVSVLHSIF